MERTYISTSSLVANNPPTQLHGLQVYLEPYLPQLQLMWWVLLFATVLELMIFLLKKYKESRKKH